MGSVIGNRLAWLLAGLATFVPVGVALSLVRAAPAEAPAAGVPRQEPHDGYVGSASCRRCHKDEHESWSRSFHRTMTQVATPDSVKGPWQGTGPLPVKDGDLFLERRGDAFWVRLRPRNGGGAAERTYRVGLVTGSHHMQIYWVVSGRGTTLNMMPYAYLLGDRRWVAARDTFLADPRIDWKFDVWNTTCVQCHAVAGQPRPTGRADATQTRAAELGIACEACHGPGDRHVFCRDKPGRCLGPGGKIADPIVNPEKLPQARSADVCGQCHGLVVISEYEQFLAQGFSYRPGGVLATTRPPLEPGHPVTGPHLKGLIEREPGFFRNRYWPDGAVRVTGREHASLRRSPCYERGPMTCLSCHALHDYRDRDDQLAHERDSDAACTTCHARVAAGLEAHTHHKPASAGSRCQNCHMPHTTYGLLKAIRTHQIASPDVATTVATGRPNACNLCHLDRSLGWTAEYLQRWYRRRAPELPAEQKTTAAAVLLALRGDAVQRALVAWHAGWEPARAASGHEWLAGFLTLALSDTYSAVRYIAEKSLRTLPGFAQVTYDYTASTEGLDRLMPAIIAAWGKQRRPLPPDKAARLLMRPDGSLDSPRIAAELQRRDDTPLELNE